MRWVYHDSHMLLRIVIVRISTPLLAMLPYSGSMLTSCAHIMQCRYVHVLFIRSSVRLRRSSITSRTRHCCHARIHTHAYAMFTHTHMQCFIHTKTQVKREIEEIIDYLKNPALLRLRGVNRSGLCDASSCTLLPVGQC